MPITTSAKKALRVSRRRRVFNVRRRDTLRTVLKEVRALAAAGKKTEATAIIARAYQAIDKAAKRGVLKANTAARKKSFVARAVR